MDRNKFTIANARLAGDDENMVAASGDTYGKSRQPKSIRRTDGRTLLGPMKNALENSTGVLRAAPKIAEA
jgi:hypothetical protein